MSGQAQGQTVGYGASTAIPLLSLNLGARGEGMGESFTAVSDDAAALTYNPAGLARLFRPEISLTHNNDLPNGFAETLGYVQPLPKGGALGFSFQYLNYGSIDTRNFGGNLKPYVPEDIDASLAYGFSLSEKIGVGLRAQWLRQSLFNNFSLQGLMGDFGLLVGPLDRVYLGLDFKNLGIDTSGPSLPAEMLVGASYRLGSEPSEAHSLIFSLGQDLLLQGTLKLNAGVEFGYLKRYFLRAGYNLDLQATLFNSTTGLSFGAGILLGQLGADYSFSSFGGQGGVHRFSLSLFLPPMERPGEGAKAPSTPLTVAAPVSPGGPVADKPVEMKFEMTETSGLTKNQLFERGREKEKLGLREEAIDLYLKAVDKDPDFEKAWLRLGQLFLDKSLESYRKALEKNPKNKKLQEWLKNFNQ